MNRERLYLRWKGHFTSIVGEKRADEEKINCVVANRLGTVRRYCTTVRGIFNEYDIGVAIATDGLYTGYIAQNLGFPVLNIVMKRKGNGAIYVPKDEISEKTIRGKRVLVFDVDVVTGRTLRRVSQDIEKLAPDVIGVCLETRCTSVSMEKYRQWGKRLKGKTKIVGKADYGHFVLDTSRQIPSRFRKTHYLDEIHVDPNPEDFSEFYKNAVG